MSFWDDFTGASARKDLRRGREAQRNELMSGYNEAFPMLTEGYDTARGYIDPYVQTGARYQSMYDDLMGLNGPEARAAAQATITSDPIWSGQFANASNAASRLLNSRGLGGSGAMALAGQRVLQENYQPVLNRYQQGGTQGLAAAGTAAGITQGKGESTANLRYGNAQQLAGVEGNFANSMASSRSTLTNNLLGLGGLLIGGFTPNIAGQTAFGAMGGALNKLWGAGAQANPTSSTSFTTPNATGSPYAYNFNWGI